jgi:transcriptional regulator with PAS, ATPase and Fis domain
LNIFEIKIPPLRERIKDIAPLTHYFVKQFSEKVNKKIVSIDVNFLHKMETYHWPEMSGTENVIERSVI